MTNGNGFKGFPAGPNIIKQPVQPGDQPSRQGPTQELQMCHYDTPLAGCGQVAAPDEQLFNSSGRVGNPDLCSLDVAGRFADNKQFELFGIAVQMYFTQINNPAAGEAGAEELYDLASYFSRMVFVLANAEKQVLWVDQIPAGGGVNGFSQAAGAFHLTNGLPLSGGFYRLTEGVTIIPGATFKFIWRWLASVTNVAGAATMADPRTRFNAAINSGKLLRIMIHGIEGRNVTNG